ncbi:MAG TPA: recombinase family protein [Syntrophobacteria bacterium]|nr:recombinase family protein [Syntrophobacteria bacterium]
MLIGYARASTVEEGLELQVEALNGAGVDRDRIFVEEKVSGAKAEHPQREQAESLLGEGDTLVVWSLDRLDRSVRDLVKMIDGLTRLGVGFRSLKENIDTTSGTDKPLSHFFAALAQCERALVRERSAAGRAAAKDRGLVGGRKLKLDEAERAQANALYQDSPHSIADICRKFDISRPTLYRYLD